MKENEIKENEEDILKKYKLSEEDHDFYYDVIKRTYQSKKTPVSNPVAVIVGGQTGAGKTGIIGYSTTMFSDDNVIIINSDEIKPFHPKSEEIAKLYPGLYTKITDQESNTWTSKLFEELREEGYNIIFEGTMRNDRIINSIDDLKEKGYTVVVRGLSVCNMESMLSILERFIGQVKTKGWGRLVTIDHHNDTYKNMPETINSIEQKGAYDILEIFSRGEKPNEPTLIYANYNKDTEDKTKKVVEDKENVSKYSKHFGYENGKDAVLKGREEEYERVLPTVKGRTGKIIDSMKDRETSKSEQEVVDSVLNLYDKIKKKECKKECSGVIANKDNDIER